MLPIGVFYATREGHTRRIADRLAADLRAHSFEVEVCNVLDYPVGIGLRKYSGVVLTASAHVGVHEPEMVTFVRHNLSDLETMPAAFLSVSLSAAGAERRDATPAERARFCASVQGMLDRFFADTGWRPELVKPVAGALLYTKYTFLARLVLQQISRRAGGDTDTSRDYEYTDWAGLDRFADEFAERVTAASSTGVAARK